MKRIAWLALALLALLTVPGAAYADKSYTVSRAFVTVTLARSGEVLMREDLTFSYDGYFTGAYRDIPLAPDVEVSDVSVSEGAGSYTPGGNTTLGSNDVPGRFGIVRLPQGLRIVWHYQQDGGQRTYTLRYRLRGVVTAYDDAVEVAPQVWGDQWKSALPQLYANVHASGTATGTHAWIEPPWLDHNVTIRGSDVSSVTEDVPAKHHVILRVLYPTSVLDAGAPYAKHVHEDIVATTIAREQAAADKAAHDKQELDDTLHHPWAWILAAFALAIIPAAVLGGLAYVRFGREHSTGSAPEYVHEPPDDLAAALVPSLLAQKVIAGGDQMAATLFELVRRGRYKMTAVTREESSLAGLRHKEVDDVDLERGDESIELAAVEKPVAEIFDRLTRDGPIALSQVTQTVKDMDQTDRIWFSSRSDAFDGAIRNQARQRQFWGGHGMLVKWLAFVGFLIAGGLLLAAGIIGLADPPLVRRDLVLTGAGVALALNALVVVLLPAPMWRRRRATLQASAEQWAGFRRYLEEFPRLADKPADTLPLWERYLVYGISFGIAERVLEAAKVQFPAITTSSVYAPALYASSFHTASFANDLGGAFPDPTSSSSSGGGGGGGGSFGGGGGGAW